MNCLTEKQLSMEQIVPLIRESLAEGKSVRFSPKGVSMKPMLRQGKDSVVLSAVPERLKKYDLPLYQRENGQYVLHRVVTVGDTYTCVGDNQFVLETWVEHHQMIAVVSAFARDGRRIEADDPGYRLYCRIWCASRPVRHLWRRGTGWLKRAARRCLK